MTKKILFYMLIVCMSSLILLAGCQKKAAPPAAGSQVSAAQGQSTKDPYGKYSPEITLTTVRTMSNNDPFDANDPDKRSYEENRWVRTYKENLGINLKYAWISPDSDSNNAKWSAAIAASNVPDFANVSDNVYQQLYDAGLIADMTDIWKDYVTDEYVKSLGPQDIAMMTIDGGMLGFPGGTRGYAGSSVLYLRQDWMDKLGLKAPESIDELIDIIRKFKDAKLAGNDTIPFLLSSNVSGGLNFIGSDAKWDGFFNGFGAYLNYWIVKDGKLAYSTVQPEVRTALLKLQQMYSEGLINKDFAALNVNAARELVAAGKVGAQYASAWSVTGGMNTLLENTPQFKATPEKMIANMFPPPAVKGQTVTIQCNGPKGYRIFVSDKTSNPEAVLKLATLTYHYGVSGKENYKYYIEGDWNYFKYIPWGDHMTPVNWDLYRAYAIRVAQTTGDTSLIDENSWNTTWDFFQQAAAGTAPPGALGPALLMMNGKYGTFSLLYDRLQQNQVMVNAYMGLPTATMALKGDILRGTLEAAMFDVVMGANISVWDDAVKKWYADGGDQILTEINTVYTANTK